MSRVLDEARESLAELEEIERFLLEDVGGSGQLTLANSGKWASELARCRELLANQKSVVETLAATENK